MMSWHGTRLTEHLQAGTPLHRGNSICSQQSSREQASYWGPQEASSRQEASICVWHWDQKTGNHCLSAISAKTEMQMHSELTSQQDIARNIAISEVQGAVPSA